jgi:hypothetical protein
MTLSLILSFLKIPNIKIFYKFFNISVNYLIEVENILLSLGIISRPKWDSSPNKNVVEKVQEISNSSLNGIELINYEAFFHKFGILTKIAKIMAADSNFFIVSKHPTVRFDWSHQIYYRFAMPLKEGQSSFLVTHVDTKMKMFYIKFLIKRNLIPICISQETANFIANFIPNISTKIYWINPFPIISETKRRVKIGFFSNIYRDGRKNENFLDYLIENLDNTWVEFILMGENLELIVQHMGEFGFTFKYLNHFDQDFYEKAIETIDLLVYFGKDEGAMSVLDLLKAGCRVAASKTGFHLDITSPGLFLMDDRSDYLSFIKKEVSERILISESVASLSRHTYEKSLINIVKENFSKDG